MYLKNYKENLIKEYYKLLDEITALSTLINSYNTRTIINKEEIKTPLELLNEQYDIMVNYLMILLKRIKIENIDLELEEHLC